ncbi:MAG: hypothetical protein OHK0038_02430 [Flammeovirgaceae bacterium]
MQPKARSTMKQKEIVLKASRFSVVTAFVLGSVLGLNSCRDEFNDEDQLKLELEALEAAKRRADSMRIVEMQAELQATLDEIRLTDSITRSRDSLAAIKGKFYYAVNVVYGNTAVFAGTDANGRTSDTERLAGATVSVSQRGVKSTVTLGNDGMAVFPNWFVAGELTGTIVKTGFTPVQFKVVLDAPARVADDDDDNQTGFTPPVYSASSIVPVFELPAGNATLDPVRFSQVGGNFTIESDLTNTSRESLDGAANGVIVTANIDGNGEFFNIFKTAQQAEVISGDGDLLGQGATSEIVELSYSSAVFAASVSGNSYTMVVPASPTNNGLPFKVKFSDVALNQTHFDVAGNQVTSRAVFGAELREVIPAVSSLNFAKVELTQPEDGGQGASIDYSVNAFVDAQGTVISFSVSGDGMFNSNLLGGIAGRTIQAHELSSLFNVSIDHFDDPASEDEGDDTDGVAEPNYDLIEKYLELEDISITFSEADANGMVSITSVTLTEGHLGGLGYVKAPEVTITSSATPVVVTTTYSNVGEVEQINTNNDIATGSDIQGNEIDVVQLFSSNEVKLKVAGGALDKIFVLDEEGNEVQVSNSSVTVGSGFTQVPAWTIADADGEGEPNTPYKGASLDIDLNTDGSLTITLVNGGSGFSADENDDVSIKLWDTTTGKAFQNVYDDADFTTEATALANLNDGQALAKVSRMERATGIISEVYVDGNNYGKYTQTPKAVVIKNGSSTGTGATFEVVMGEHPDGDGTLQVDKIIVTASGSGYNPLDQVVLVDDIVEEAVITPKFQEFPLLSDGDIFFISEVVGFSEALTVTATPVTQNTDGSYSNAAAASILSSPTATAVMEGTELTTIELTQKGEGYSRQPTLTIEGRKAYTLINGNDPDGNDEYNGIYLNNILSVPTLVTLADLDEAYDNAPLPGTTLSGLSYEELRQIPVVDFEVSPDGPVIAFNDVSNDKKFPGNAGDQIDVAFIQIDASGNSYNRGAFGQLTLGGSAEIDFSSNPFPINAGGSYFTQPNLTVTGVTPSIAATAVMERDQLGALIDVVPTTAGLDVNFFDTADNDGALFIRFNPDGVSGVGTASQRPAIFRVTLNGNNDVDVDITEISLAVGDVDGNDLDADSFDEPSQTARGRGISISDLEIVTGGTYNEIDGITLSDLFGQTFGIDTDVFSVYGSFDDARDGVNAFTVVATDAALASAGEISFEDIDIASANIDLYSSSRITDIVYTPVDATGTPSLSVATPQSNVFGNPDVDEESAVFGAAFGLFPATVTVLTGGDDFDNADNIVIVPINTVVPTSTPSSPYLVNIDDVLFAANLDKVQSILGAATGTVGSVSPVIARDVVSASFYEHATNSFATGNGFSDPTPTVLVSGPDLTATGLLGYSPVDALVSVASNGLKITGVKLNTVGAYLSDVDGIQFSFTKSGTDTGSGTAPASFVVDFNDYGSNYSLYAPANQITVQNPGTYDPNIQLNLTVSYPNDDIGNYPFSTNPLFELESVIETDNLGELPVVPIQDGSNVNFAIFGTVLDPGDVTYKKAQEKWLSQIDINASTIFEDAILEERIEVGDAVAAVEIIRGGGIEDDLAFTGGYTAAPHVIFPDGDNDGVRSTGTATLDSEGRVTGVTVNVLDQGDGIDVGSIIRFATFGEGDMFESDGDAKKLVDVSATQGFGSVTLGTDGIEGFNNDGSVDLTGYRSEVRFSSTPRVTVTAYEYDGSGDLVEKGSGLQVEAIMSAAGTGEVVGFNVVAGGEGYSSSDYLKIVLSNESSTTTTTGGNATMSGSGVVLATTLDAANNADGSVNASIAVEMKGENYLGDGRFRNNDGAGLVDIIFYEGTLSGTTDEEKMTSLKEWIRGWEASGNEVAYAGGTPEAGDPFAEDTAEGLSSVTLQDGGSGYTNDATYIVLSRKQSILLEAALEGYTLVEQFSNPDDPDTKNEFAWWDPTNEKTKEASAVRVAEGYAVIGANGSVESINVTEPGHGYFAAPDVNISYQYNGPAYTSGVNGECTVDWSTDANDNGIIEESEYVSERPECIAIGSGAEFTATIDDNGSVTGFTQVSGGQNYGSGADVQNWQYGSYETAKIGGEAAVKTGNTYNILTGVKIIRDIFYGTGWRGILKSE